MRGLRKKSEQKVTLAIGRFCERGKIRQSERVRVGSTVYISVVGRQKGRRGEMRDREGIGDGTVGYAGS